MIDPDTALEQFGLDTLVLLQMFDEAWRRFGLELDGLSLSTISSLRSLAAAVAARLVQPAAPSVFVWSSFDPEPLLCALEQHRTGHPIPSRPCRPNPASARGRHRAGLGA